MTASKATPLPVTAPPGAAHVGDWALSDDDRIAHRWFHLGEHTTAGGLRTKVHGMQYADGSVEGLSISISDETGDVSFDATDIVDLIAHLTHASIEHEQIESN